MLQALANEAPIRPVGNGDQQAQVHEPLQQGDHVYDVTRRLCLLSSSVATDPADVKRSLSGVRVGCPGRARDV